MHSCAVASFVGLSIALSVGYAQTETPKPATKVSETPSDQKAYTAASRTMDPTKKLEALEKFKADFPTSDMLSSADSVILRTLVKQFPSQKGRIMKQAKAMYNGAEAREKGSTANEIADRICGCRAIPRRRRTLRQDRRGRYAGGPLRQRTEGGLREA